MAGGGDLDFEQEIGEVMASPRCPAGSSTDPGEHEGSKECDDASGSDEGAVGTAEAEGDEGGDERDEEIVNLDL